VVLSTFRASTTLATVPAILETGQDTSSSISPRSAIVAADARGGTDKINSGGRLTLNSVVVANNVAIGTPGFGPGGEPLREPAAPAGSDRALPSRIAYTGDRSDVDPGARSSHE